MATVNVYVSDALKSRLEGSDLNLSAIAQRCWETELALALMKPSEVRIDATDSGTGEVVELRFTGTLLGSSSHDGQMYLTDEDMVVYIDADTGKWWAEPRDTMDGDAVLNAFRHDEEAASSAMSALGIKRVIQL